MLKNVGNREHVWRFGFESQANTEWVIIVVLTDPVSWRVGGKCKPLGFMIHT